VKILITTALVLQTAHQEKYTIQRLQHFRIMMILDSILVHYVWNHALVSALYNIPVIVLIPGTRFEQGTFCVSECQPGFQTVGRVCEPCPNGVCVGGRST